MRPDTIFARLDAAAGPHRSGHRCLDGQWYNPHAGARTPCPTAVTLAAAREDVARLHAAPHAAAHDAEAVDRITEAMLAGTPLADLDPEQADGWRHLARLAVEALAEHLERDPAREARAAAASGRLSAALALIDRAEALAEQGDRL